MQQKVETTGWHRGIVTAHELIVCYNLIRCLSLGMSWGMSDGSNGKAMFGKQNISRSDPRRPTSIQESRRFIPFMSTGTYSAIIELPLRLILAVGACADEGLQTLPNSWLRLGCCQ